MPGEVEVQLSSIRRAWSNGGHHEFWVRLRTTDGDFNEFGEAIDRANRAEGPDGIFAQGETPAPKGFVVMARTGHDDRAENLDRWATELGRLLEELGFSGTLQGVRPIYWPDWVAETGFGLVAFFRWSIDLARLTKSFEHSWNGGWPMPDDATNRIAEQHAAWAEPGGPAIIVSEGTFKFAVSDGSTVGATLGRAAAKWRRPNVLRYVDAERTGRAAVIGSGGESTLQIIDGRAERWEHRIDELRRGMTALPDLLDVAFLRPSRCYALSWHDLEIRQKLSGIDYGDVVFRGRHLLTEYVPDAHGLQVLRDEHLAHARDLSAWTVTDLGEGRHLVEARDLAPWYTTPVPDPDVVEQARHDFGDMILTKDLIAANPAPWTRKRS
jgi:hypothetical protein